MRTYIVQDNDSPGTIAIRFAECPKCSRDLCLANDHKSIVTHRNGYITFESLSVGEILTLPEKWFEPRFELLPPAYFASLPYADGVTPSPFGNLAPVILRDFRALDVAADKLYELVHEKPCVLSLESEPEFAVNVSDVVCCIEAALQPALRGSNEIASHRARDAQEALWWATEGQRDRRGDPNKARIDVFKMLELAIHNAQHAIGKLYGSVQPPGYSRTMVTSFRARSSSTLRRSRAT